MAKKPKDIDVTEPTAKTVDNSPVNETPKASEHTHHAPLKPNQQVTLSGALRTDH